MIDQTLLTKCLPNFSPDREVTGNFSTTADESYRLDYLEASEAGRIILKYMSDDVGRMSPNYAENPDPVLEERAKSVCRALAESLPDFAMPNLKSKNVEVAFMSPERAIQLDIIPERFTDHIEKYLKRKAYGKFPSYNTLLEGDLDLLNIDGSLPPNSPLEWYIASDYVTGSQGQQRSYYKFVAQMVELLVNAADSELRRAHCLDKLHEQRERFQFYNEFGDLPVSVDNQVRFTQDPQQGWGVTLDHHAALDFGFKIAVFYIAKEKTWLLLHPSTFTRDVDNSREQRELAVGITSFTFARSSCIQTEAWSHNGLRAALKTLNKKYPSLRQGAKSPVGSTLEFPEPDVLGTSHNTFYGSIDTRPIIVEQTRDMSLIPDSIRAFQGPKLEPKEKRLIGKIAFELVGKRNDYEEIGVIFGEKLSPRSKQFAKLGSQLSATGKSLTEFVFADENRLMVFREPLRGIDSKILLGSRKGKRASTVDVYGFQRVSHLLEWLPITEEPTIPVAHSRFAKSPLKLDSSTDNLELGVPLNRHRLTFEYDPQLDELGFPRNERGDNSLLDYWHVSLPLVKPSPEHFGLDFFQPIRGLQNVPAQSWLAMLHAIEGEWVEDIEHVEKIKQEEDKGPGYNIDPDSINTTPRLGDYYKNPREKITVCGSWILSHCQIESVPYYVVDSPLYAKAMFLFREEKGAMDAAKHLERGGHRTDVRYLNGFVARIVHRNNWKQRASSLIVEKILGKTKDVDNFVNQS